MPFYEYLCPNCNKKFTIMRSFSDSGKETNCPECDSVSKRLISDFSHHSGLAPDSADKESDSMSETMWNSKRKLEDIKIKNPDPLKSWREERTKTLGYGPEKWTEWANEEMAKKKEKESYDEKWLGREI